MTHPNGSAHDSCYIYNLAIKFLLENRTDPDRAEKCFEFCLNETESFEVAKTLGPHGYVGQNVNHWLVQAKNMFEEFKKSNKEPLVSMLPEALSAQGWLKVCTSLSFYWLLRAKDIEGSVYDYVIRETIRCGGDTDTNACIVGGMIGALIGFKKLNQVNVGKVF